MYDENYKLIKVYYVFIYIYVQYTFIRKIYNNKLYKF